MKLVSFQSWELMQSFIQYFTVGDASYHCWMEVVQVLQLGLMTMHLLLQMEFLCQTFKTDFMESITSDYMGFKKNKKKYSRTNNKCHSNLNVFFRNVLHPSG